MSDDLKDPGSPVKGDPIEWTTAPDSDDECLATSRRRPSPTTVPSCSTRTRRRRWHRPGTPGRPTNRPSPGRLVAATMDQRADHPGPGHFGGPRDDDGHHDDGRPSQPRVARQRPGVRRHDADRRRHGCPRVGARVPPRLLPPELPAVRLEHGLVRRAAALPLLHGDSGARHRRPRRGPAVRGRLQARGGVGARALPARLLGVRPARRVPPSRSPSCSRSPGCASCSTRATRSTAAT